MSTQISDIVQLSVAERIQLVQDIWDSIATVPESIELTEQQKQELDKRLAAYKENPNEGIAWHELKQKLAESR
jgi:putative addiction module component (TIGR02574 family)